MFSGPASHCVRSPGNRARPGDSDRKAGRRAARTSAMKREGRAAGEASARLWGRPLCKRWRAHLSVSCDKKSGVPRDVPFLELGPAILITAARRWPTESPRGFPFALSNLYSWYHTCLSSSSLCSRGSAERERESLHACIEKLDLELAIRNMPRLADQLIEPRVGQRAVALLVNVNSMSRPRRLSIEEHAKSHGRSSRCRSHDQMEIAGVKAVRDAPVGRVQHRGPSLHRPLTRKGPLIEPQPYGGSIDVTLVQDCTTGRCKVLGALRADIGFRRPEAPPIGGSFSPLSIDRDQFVIEATDSGFSQQVLNNLFRLFVGTLAVVMIAKMPLGIDEIEGRPIVVRESVPDRIVVIDRDGIRDPHVLSGPAHVLEVVLKGELRRVDADHHHAVLLVFLGPRADIGQGAQPVDAGVGPEVDEDDFSSQADRRAWLRIEPRGCP